MFKEMFLGKTPSHFTVNPTVKAFIISESFLWSAWNFFMPIAAIFVTTSIAGGTIEIAAFAYSIHLIVRVVAELISGRFLTQSTDKEKVTITVVGILLLCGAYLGLAVTSTITHLFFFYSIAGAGLGIASPAKMALFSTHLDRHKETAEWGLNDAMTFICIAMAATIGGFLAGTYGFKILFVLATVINLLAALPYLLFFRGSQPK